MKMTFILKLNIHCARLSQCRGKKFLPANCGFFITKNRSCGTLLWVDGIDAGGVTTQIHSFFIDAPALVDRTDADVGAKAPQVSVRLARPGQKKKKKKRNVSIMQSVGLATTFAGSCHISYFKKSKAEKSKIKIYNVF